jgi:hypothetical protein
MALGDANRGRILGCKPRRAITTGLPRRPPDAAGLVVFGATMPPW